MTSDQQETLGGVLVVALVLGAALLTGKGCGGSSPPGPPPAPQYRQAPGPVGVPYHGGGVDYREQQRIHQQYQNRMREIQEEQRRWNEERRRQDEKFRGNPYMR